MGKKNKIEMKEESQATLPDETISRAERIRMLQYLKEQYQELKNNPFRGPYSNSEESAQSSQTSEERGKRLGFATNAGKRLYNPDEQGSSSVFMLMFLTLVFQIGFFCLSYLIYR